jgi:hypothetical protein
MQAQKGTGRGCLWLFGGVFVLVGGGFFVFGTALPLMRLADAMSWDETPCVIESSTLHYETSDDGTTYRPDITYSYAYGDGDYYGSRYTFAEGTSSGRNRHQKAVDRYRPGNRAVCYVNPNNPEESVLSRKVTVDYLFGCLGLIFVAAGLLVIVLGTYAGKSSAAKSHRAVVAGRMKTDDVGPTTLEPQAGPIAKFIGITIVALFWNGIVSIFVFGAANDADGMKWFVYLFMTPFVLIGLGLICWRGVLVPRAVQSTVPHQRQPRRAAVGHGGRHRMVGHGRRAPHSRAADVARRPRGSHVHPRHGYVHRQAHVHGDSKL